MCRQVDVGSGRERKPIIGETGQDITLVISTSQGNGSTQNSGCLRTLGRNSHCATKHISYNFSGSLIGPRRLLGVSSSELSVFSG
jgi:hypothetical protein